MTYNFDKVQEAEFCCEVCFVENILKEYDKLNPNDYESIVIVAKEYLAQDLFRDLSEERSDTVSRFGEHLFNFGFVDYNSHDYSGEYMITLNYDGSLSLEKMVGDKGIYLYTEGKIVFIHEDCNYKAIDRLNDGYNNIVIFGFEEDDDWDD